MAVEVVIQTVSIVAGLVAVAVVEVAPAARVWTISPGIHCQRTVAAVPVTGVRVTLLVTDAIVGFAFTVCDGAGEGRDLHDLLAPVTGPATRTLAVEEREAGLLGAHAAVLAGLRGAALVAAMLTLGPAVAWHAGATRPSGGGCTATSIVAGQFPAGHASVAVKPSVPLKTQSISVLRLKNFQKDKIAFRKSVSSATYKLACADVAKGRVAGYRAGATILARLRLAHTEPVLTSAT